MQIPLKSIGDVSAVLEETINRVRQGPFDLRAANAIGFLAGILLKAIEQGCTEEHLNYLETIVGCNKGAETDVFHFVPAKEAPHEQPCRRRN